MPQNFTWRKAIETVLNGASGPMHYTEIADQIAQRKLRRDLGATPASTVAAVIGESLKTEGPRSPFARPQRGMYTLRAQESTVEQAEAPETETSQVTGVVNAFGMFWDRSKVLW